MSDHGATLQTFNQELVKCLEELKVKRRKLHAIIEKEETDKAVLERNIKSLQDKMLVLNQNLSSHRDLRQHYDKTIQDTEVGFRKILESSQALLNLAQHESSTLDSRIEKIKLDV